MRACSGAQTSRFSAAKPISVGRQPAWITSHCASGTKIVLAKPAISVTTMMGFWYWSP
ncbi:hypothetical protein D3C87_2131250 [compost metagenome]